MWIWVVMVGLLIGVALGSLGGGGSILTVPALVYLLGQPPAVATTGSLVIVGVSALMAMAAHARAGKVRVAHGLTFGLLGTAGSYAGSRLSVHVPPHALLAAFSVLLLIVAVLMYRRTLAGRPAPGSPSASTSSASAGPGVDAGGAGEGRGGDAGEGRGGDAGEGRWVWSVSGVLTVMLAASGVGLLTGFFGVGGGFAVVPALVLVLRFSMPVAVGTSLLVIAINSATAFVSRLGSGVTLDWGVIVAFTAVAVVGSLIGARVAGRVDARVLTRVFSGLLVLVGLALAVENVPLVLG